MLSTLLPSVEKTAKLPVTDTNQYLIPTGSCEVFGDIQGIRTQIRREHPREGGFAMEMGRVV